MADLKLKEFTYTAVSDAGERVTGRMQATAEGDVIATLHRSGYTPLEVTGIGGFSLDADVGQIFRGLFPDDPKFSASDLAGFTRQLHQMLRAGIPIGQSIALLADGYPKEKVANALRTVSEDITGGLPLNEAFGRHPKLFNEVFVAYMSAGEQSGDLVDVTDRLAHILDKRAEIQRKFVSVSMYPALVMGAIFLMLAVIILFIVPRYVSIYASFDAPLPAPTKAVVMLSKVFPLIVLLIGGGVGGFIAFNKSRKDDLDFGEKLDRLRFRLPIFGKLAWKLTLFRFISTTSGALDAGVQAHDALELAGRAAASRWVRKVVPDLQDKIQSGEPLWTGLAEHEDLFPPVMRNMVATGEQTGELATMLSNVSDALEDDIDLIIAMMSAKVEVALLMFMGVTVGSILLALYLPILQLSTTAGQKYGF